MRLIDADGHNGFPNLALMRISAWHKARGDDVQWWFGFDHYDIVYISKVFRRPTATMPIRHRTQTLLFAAVLGMQSGRYPAWRSMIRQRTSPYRRSWST